MEVLEAIQRRRTVRVPFNEKKILERDIDTMMKVSRISPTGGPISWKLVSVHDPVIKSELAKIVKEEFGNTFQKNSDKFREVYSKYPEWLRFSTEAQDGITLLGQPKFFKYVYGLGLGKQYGPFFGKLGIMSREVDLYCKNIVRNPVLLGVFLDKHAVAEAGGVKPVINTGAMLQNLRLAATSIGLDYQDLGWISATKNTAEKARQLLGVSENYIAVNFFRVGNADEPKRESKKSDFRRDLKDITYYDKFGNTNSTVPPVKRTDIEVLDAIKGKKASRVAMPVSKDELVYILEAARWAPTGFNVQPFEYVVTTQGNDATLVVLENKERRDPDPGPCEALARGGVLQNIILASRALGIEYRIKQPVKTDADSVKKKFSIPLNYAVVGLVELNGGEETQQ